MKMNSKIEYLAPKVAQYEFRVEEGMAESETGAVVNDLQEDDTYSNGGEWL